MEEKIRLAVFGQKRLSREGGIEIVVKELCTRMAQNGCDITCYNRAGHHVSGAEYDKTIEYDGIRQKVVPTIEKKGLAAVSSSFFAALCSAFGRYDVVHRDKLNFDYLVLHDRHEDLEDIVLGMGSKKIVASADDVRNKFLRGITRWYRLYRTFKDNNIKVLHLNGGPSSDMNIVFLAKLAGVKHVTFHTHNAGSAVYRNKISVIMSNAYKPLMPAFVDSFWACSSLAAQFSFPKKIVVNQVYKFIPNGIALEKYAFDLTIREKVRRDLGVENKFVIGHAGRFNVQKNHEYLIDVFASLHKECNDAVLLLFGDGELRESMQQKVKKLHLEESVHFMGTTNEMQKMYQAMDVFVMPSFCEGLPVAGVEAQASGLPVLLADTITKEVDVTDCVKYLPLSKDKSAWVKEIQSFRDFKRYSRIEELRKAGFDEKDVAKYFQDFYLNILDKL